MKIIVVGAGKTGATLVKSLTEEGHNVTIIDQLAQRVESICNDEDVLGIVGNGMNYSALSEAGIFDADLMIAVTGSDEQNLLCSLFARKTGNCATIARIRNPLYITETEFIKEQVGLSMVINPEFATASAIARLLRFPYAIEINSFSKGQAEMLTFRVPKGSVLNGKNLTYVRSRLESNLLVCSVKRGNEFTIPSGTFELKEGDKVTILARQKDAARFFKQIKLDTQSVKNVIIVGGGTISYYLAKMLLDDRIAVKIIESDEARCHELAERLPEAMIIHGDASDKSLLMEEGITTTDAFVALTGFDEENVLLSLYAKELTDSKVITKVGRPVFNELIGSLDLDSVVYPLNITAENILQYVRARQNARGNNIETLYKLMEDQVEALEFKIGDNAPGTHIPLKELSLKENIIIGGISRGRQFIIPGGDSTIQPGDRVIIITGQKKLNDFKDILK